MQAYVFSVFVALVDQMVSLHRVVQSLHQDRDAHFLKWQSDAEPYLSFQRIRRSTKAPSRRTSVYGNSDIFDTCSSVWVEPPAFSIAAFRSSCRQSPNIAGCFAVILAIFQCERSRIFAIVSLVVH